MTISYSNGRHGPDSGSNVFLIAIRVVGELPGEEAGGLFFILVVVEDKLMICGGVE